MSPLPHTAALRRLPLPGVWGMAIVAVLIAFGLAAAGAWLDRTATRKHEIAELTQFTRIEAAQARSFVASISRLLDLVKFAAEREDAPFSIQRLIDQKRISIEELAQLSIADAQGIVRQSTLPMGAAPVSVADRRHFKALADGEADFFIGQPVLGRVSGLWTVQVARRIDTPEGGFGGAIVASIDIAHFGGIAGRIANLPSAATAIVGGDGLVRARAGATPADIALDANLDSWMPILRSADSGLSLGDSVDDGERRAIAWQRLAPFDLYVAVTLPESGMRAESDVRARLYFMAAGFAALLAFGAALVIDRRERALIRIADASDRARVEMARLLAGFGQDLRDPIDALRWASDTLSAPGGGAESQRQRALGTLRAAGAKLGRALNDVLDWVALAQSNDGHSLAALDPRDWAKLTYESVRGRARDLDVACDLGLDVPDGLRIIADTGRLHRMTNALLVHALSAAGQGGRVGFSVGVRGLDEAHVELAIAVSANGAASGTTQSYLGDAVAQGFAQSLGGTIEHREAPGGTLDVFRAGFARAA